MQIGQAAVGSIAHQICRDHSGSAKEACGVPASEVTLMLDKIAASTSGAAVLDLCDRKQPDTRRCGVRLIHREEVKQLDGSATVVSQVCEELLNSGWPILGVLPPPEILSFTGASLELGALRSSAACAGSKICPSSPIDCIARLARTAGAAGPSLIGSDGRNLSGRLIDARGRASDRGIAPDVIALNPVPGKSDDVAKRSPAVLSSEFL